MARPLWLIFPLGGAGSDSLGGLLTCSGACWLVNQPNFCSWRKRSESNKYVGGSNQEKLCEVSEPRKLNIYLEREKIEVFNTNMYSWRPWRFKFPKTKEELALARRQRLPFQSILFSIDSNPEVWVNYWVVFFFALLTPFITYNCGAVQWIPIALVRIRWAKFLKLRTIGIGLIGTFFFSDSACLNRIFKLRFCFQWIPIRRGWSEKRTTRN